MVCFWLRKVSMNLGAGTDLLCAPGQISNPLEPSVSQERVGVECGFPHPLPVGPAGEDGGGPSPLPLTTDAASSKPRAPQLMTRARTPSRHTLGAKKANQHPLTRGWGPRHMLGCRPESPRAHLGVYPYRICGSSDGGRSGQG